MLTIDEIRNHRLLWGLGVVCVVLFLMFGMSLAVGVTNIPLQEIWGALGAFNGSTEHWIVRSIRLPRSLIGVFVGASLAVSGGIMQGLTRNPIASPTLLGVNAGAALALVVGLFTWGDIPLSLEAVLALIGAALGAIAVYGLASLGRGGLTPLNLVLAGAAMTAFFSALTTTSLLLNQRAFDEIRFWLIGSISGRNAELFLRVLPLFGVGLLLALALGRQITTLSLGEAIAQGLGQQTAWVKGLGLLAVVLLAGGSVAIAGPLGFVGLITPHLARTWVGTDYRWILPYSAVFGAILVLGADILARLLLYPQELPVGLILPIFGAPFFLYLLLRDNMKFG